MRKTPRMDDRSDCWGTTRPTRNSRSSSGYPGTKNSESNASLSGGAVVSAFRMSLRSFMRKTPTTVLPVPGPPWMTMRLDAPLSRSSNNPDRMSSTAIACSCVSALNGDSLKRSEFSISWIGRVKAPLARRASKTSRKVSRYCSRP